MPNLHRCYVGQARPDDGCPASSDKWFCFDDVNVEPWDIINLDTDCFGGKYTLSAQHFSGPQQVPSTPNFDSQDSFATDILHFLPSTTFAVTSTLLRRLHRHFYIEHTAVNMHSLYLQMCPSMQEYDRPNSAYMLFYERSGVLEPVSHPSSSLTAVAEVEAAMPSLQQQEQQEQHTDAADLQSSSLSPTSPEQPCTLQQSATASATQLRELQAGSPMQTQPSAASSPQAAHLEAQESLQQHPQPSPTTALKEHVSSGLSSPVLQQPESLPSGTPNVLPHVANLSPLKVRPLCCHACICHEVVLS